VSRGGAVCHAAIGLVPLGRLGYCWMRLKLEPGSRTQFVLLVTGSVVAVCLVRWALHPILEERVPYVLFLAASAAAARWAGWKAGAAATLLSLVAATFLFVQPPGGLSVGEPAQILSALLFAGAAAVIVGAIAAERAARLQVEERDARLRQELAEKQGLERELAEAHRLESIGRLAGGVAHDFNNMLAVILGSVQLLEARPEERELIESIDLAAKRGAGLTRQLLGFARRQMMEVGPMTLNDAVEDCLKLAQRVIPEDIRLTTELRDGPWTFEGDRAQIQQVLLNLVTNARDAIPSGGTIKLTTENVTLDQEFARKNPEVTPGEYVRLTVSDDGAGMSEELRRRIFEPFFTTKGRAGTGLGLAVSYGIVKQLNGHISVQSAPGRGTQFDVYWPRSSAKLLGGPELLQPSSDALSRALHVLLVEDDELVRTTALRMLEGLGHRVICAENGAEALRLAREVGEPLDLLLTDVVMPWMNGRELAARLIETRPELAVVYMSGYTQNVVLQKGVVEPGVILLKKPFSPTELAAALGRARALARRTG
jgi:signal transduction histidine kinase/ActR/RegA family two-component response regulator